MAGPREASSEVSSDAPGLEPVAKGAPQEGMGGGAPAAVAREVEDLVEVLAETGWVDGQVEGVGLAGMVTSSSGVGVEPVLCLVFSVQQSLEQKAGHVKEGWG